MTRQFSYLCGQGVVEPLELDETPVDDGEGLGLLILLDLLAQLLGEGQRLLRALDVLQNRSAQLDQGERVQPENKRSINMSKNPRYG